MYDLETGEVTLSKWEHNKRAISRAFDSLGGSKAICEKVAQAGSATSDQFFSGLDEEIASGMTSSQANPSENVNMGDL